MPPTPAPSSSGKPVWKRWWIWGAAVAVVLIIAAMAGGSDPGSTSATASNAASASAEPPPSASASSVPSPTTGPSGNSFGDGTWLVGTDVKPGTYRAANPGDDCYWERLKNFSGGFNAIIANGSSIGGPIIIRIEKSDRGVSADGCGDWSDDIETPITQSRTAFSDGTYIVGVDISPGTYRVDADNGCYWERLRDFSGDFNSIIANDNTKGATIVKVAAADAGFSSQRCGDWRKA